MRLDAMILACLLIGLIGWQAGRRPDDRPLLFGIGALAVVMAVQRGYYWNLFGRGHGFFTANRTTALMIFIVLLVGPMLAARWKR